MGGIITRSPTSCPAPLDHLHSSSGGQPGTSAFATSTFCNRTEVPRLLSQMKRLHCAAQLILFFKGDCGLLTVDCRRRQRKVRTYRTVPYRTDLSPRIRYPATRLDLCPARFSCLGVTFRCVVYLYKKIRTCACMCTRVHVFVHARIMHSCTHMCIAHADVCPGMHSCTHMCMHVHTRACICACPHVHCSCGCMSG